MGSASPAVDGMTAVPLDDVESQLGCPGAAPAQPPKFSFGGMMAQQDWGSILTTLLLSAGLFAAMLCLGGPRQRPFLISDSTLAYPLLSDTFPIGLVLAVLVVALVGSVLAVELWVARATHADSTAAAAAALYFVLDGGMALLLCAVTTEVSKRVVGRLRPNFLAQCQPAGDGNTATVSWGDPASANPACTAPDSHSLTDAHYSFPSGHTSTAFVMAVWTAAYLSWALNARLRRSLRGRGFGRRLAAELCAAAGLLWTLAILGFAWATGISRITDFKHHPSDVIAGAFLGTLVAAFFVWRSITRLPQVVERAGVHGGVAAALPPPKQSAYMAAC